MKAMVNSFTIMDHTVNVGNNTRMKNYTYIFLTAKIKSNILFKCIISKTNSFSVLKVLLKVGTILINHKDGVVNTKSGELCPSIIKPDEHQFIRYNV